MSAEEASPDPPPAASTSSLSALADDELVVLARKRDVAAFEELISRHEEKLYRLAMRFVRNETDAREILQETFLSAWRNLDSFQGKAQFASWIYRVAVNASLMLLRSHKRHPQIAIDEVGVEALDQAAQDIAVPTMGINDDWSKRPDEQFQTAELRHHLQVAVDRLPETQRSVFLLRDVDGLSTEETGETLGVTVPTVKTRLHRARLALREAIT
ncbi:MAG TPA: sigma-70 family RNA polymerase sigma factor, partial [Propionibacteriaceae bacterium]|nr:sigma-70 family RNA polymerase sigma factor [Propionibacteriaceae bacterium]